MTVNVFSSLARYAVRQEENFLTEALVYLLNFLVERAEPSVLEVLQNICGGDCVLWFENHADIKITTQITVDEGRPDIVLTSGEHRIAFIEVKHDSSLGWEQLERYYQYLEKSHYEEKRLVLLTRSRHSIQETTLGLDRFQHVCWYEISGWLSEMQLEGETASYLVNQFLDFLIEKEMSMEKVGWEYMEGVPAFVNLINMLGTAIAEALPEEKVKRTAGWNWMGYYVGEGSDLWIGVWYRNPLILTFENNGGNNPTFSRKLSLPEIHFFSLSSGEQLESIIKFVNESYAALVNEE